MDIPFILYFYILYYTTTFLKKKYLHDSLSFLINVDIYITGIKGY